MNLTELPPGVPPSLRSGQTWDPVTDRISDGGGGSWQVRRVGMCSLCPRPGRRRVVGCVHEHTWDQVLCDRHAERAMPDGDLDCLACYHHPVRPHVCAAVVSAVYDTKEDQQA